MKIISLLRENLKLRFDSFINLQDKGFFLGIADYVKYVSKNPRFNGIIAKIDQEREADEVKLNEAEARTNKEIKEAEEELFELIQSKNLHFQQLDKVLEDYKNFKEGRIQSTSTEVESYYGHVSAIIRTIFENGYKELMGKFVSVDKESGLITNYLLSDSYLQYESELKNFRYLMKRTTWGAWNELRVVYIVVYQYQQQMELLKASNDFWRQMNLHALHEEMEEIIRDDRFQSTLTRVHFIKTSYLPHIQKIHFFIMEQLLEIESKEEQEEQFTEEQPLNDGKEKVEQEVINNDDNSIDVNKFLEQKDREIVAKIWQVVRAINVEWQLRDKNTFKIPVGKFHTLNREIEGDLESIVSSLHRRKFISVTKKLGETPPPKDDVVRPQASVWADIEEDPKILSSYETQIEIFPSRFSQLHETLQSKMINFEENVSVYINGGKSLRQIVASVIKTIDLGKKETISTYAFRWATTYYKRP